MGFVAVAAAVVHTAKRDTDRCPHNSLHLKY